MLKGTDETPEDQCLPDSLIEDLQHCIDTRGDYRREDENMGDVYLRSAIHAVRDGANDAHFRQEFDSYLKQRGVELLPILRERLAFTLKAVSFDGHLHDLDHASDMLAFKDESIEMLYDFIHASTSRQAPYLPASPVGNLCGFKITDDARHPALSPVWNRACLYDRAPVARHRRARQSLRTACADALGLEL